MANTKIKKKIIIQQIEINEVERHRQFEIKMPANVKKITGIIITANKT